MINTLLKTIILIQLIMSTPCKISMILTGAKNKILESWTNRRKGLSISENSLIAKRGLQETNKWKNLKNRFILKTGMSWKTKRRLERKSSLSTIATSFNLCHSRCNSARMSLINFRIRDFVPGRITNLLIKVLVTMAPFKLKDSPPNWLKKDSLIGAAGK